MSLENPTFDDLPPGHPIIKFCEDWKIDDWPTRTALMELIVGCVIKATQALVEDDEPSADEGPAMPEAG